MQTIETKVIAAAAGSGGGAAVGSFVLWLLGVAAWGAPSAADHAGQAMAAVPSPVSALVLVILAAAGGLTSGYAAPHTSRLPKAAADGYPPDASGRHAATDLPPAPDPGALPATEDLNTAAYGFNSPADTAGPLVESGQQGSTQPLAAETPTDEGATP